MRKLAFVFGLVLSGSLAAQAGEVVLGQVVLGRDGNNHKAAVTAPCPTMANPMVSAVQVRVQNHKTRIEQLLVTFKDGQTIPLDIREKFDAGSASRVIPLGGNRCVAAIEVIAKGDDINPPLIDLVGFTEFAGSFACVARNARGFTFPGNAEPTLEMARQSALNRCYAAGSRVCNVISCQ
jgi:hypothetical protein